MVLFISDSFMTKNILVTGGAGYIGSHVCMLLKEYGFNPICYDNLIHGHKKSIQFGPFFQGDLLNTDELNNAFEQYAPSAVIHMASFIQVNESVLNPLKYYTNNISGTLNLLESMKKYQVKNIIFSSSAAVYGNPIETPINETHVCSPINPYGATKLMIENILKDCFSSHMLNFVSLRYFNAAGASPCYGLGEEHEPETHLIPLLIRAYLKNEVFTVYGDNFDTPDGTCIRDFVHVHDIAKAHVLALNYLEENAKPLIANLGSEEGHSIKKVINTLEKIIGDTVNYAVKNSRAGDPSILVSDAKRAHEKLKWRFEKNLDDILRDVWEWETRYGACRFNTKTVTTHHPCHPRPRT